MSNSKFGWYATTGIGLACIAILIIALLMSADYFIAHHFASIASADVKNVLGLPPLLVKAIYYGTVLIFLTAWWYMAVVRKSQRLFWTFATALFPCAYYGSLYYLTKEDSFSLSGDSLQCFVVTAQSVRIVPLIEPGNVQIDKETGQPCQTLTAQITPMIRKLQAILSTGKEVVPVQPNENDFFSVLTGEPLLWYAQDGESIRFYDVPGFDRSTGQPLKPVTSEIQRKWKQRKDTEAQVVATRNAESLKADAMKIPSIDEEAQHGGCETYDIEKLREDEMLQHFQFDTSPGRCVYLRVPYAKNAAPMVGLDFRKPPARIRGSYTAQFQPEPVQSMPLESCWPGSGDGAIAACDAWFSRWAYPKRIQLALGWPGVLIKY